MSEAADPDRPRPDGAWPPLDMGRPLRDLFEAAWAHGYTLNLAFEVRPDGDSFTLSGARDNGAGP